MIRVSPRTIVLAASLWLTAALAMTRAGVGESWVHALEAMGRAEEPSARLKIFSLDDSTYAALRRPSLTAETWRRIVATLERSKPRVIVTNHMFGTGELDDPALRSALAGVVAGAFAYPGTIQHRDALANEIVGRPLGRSLPAMKVDGTFYGPDAQHAATFRAIGHAGYDGTGRIAAAIRIAPTRAVPHLALASLADPWAPLANRTSARLRIDFPAPGSLAARTKSLRSLLRDYDAGTVSPHVQEGDTVLLLTDMYIGRVNFVATPQGMMPGGYVVAAALSNALESSFAREAGEATHALSLAALGSAVLGALASAPFLLVALFLAALGIASAGLTTFALAAFSWPWLPTLVAALGPATSLGLTRLVRHLRAESEARTISERETAKLTAVVRTAQMLAHDVRKPFSVLNLATRTLAKERDPAKRDALFERLLPDVERAAHHAEAMLQDILDIDAAERLAPVETPVEELLRTSLEDTFAGRNQVDVQLAYELRHTLPVQVDPARLRRVLGNVIDNAVQAMGGKGRLWLRSRDVVEGERAFIELTIGNAGSLIAEGDVPRIFEAFFTRGKAQGTGLGLAIARKIVEAHGGRIWCRSSREVGTEFFMTLPISETPPQHPPVTASMPAGFTVVAAATEPDATALTVTAQPQPMPDDRPWIAVVDDNVFALEAWTTLVDDAHVVPFESPSAFWRYADAHPGFVARLSALVTDYHFDQPGEVDGLVFSEAVRNIAAVPIFLSSDAELKDVAKAGVDARIAKEPMPLAALSGKLRDKAGA